MEFNILSAAVLILAIRTHWILWYFIVQGIVSAHFPMNGDFAVGSFSFQAVLILLIYSNANIPLKWFSHVAVVNSIWLLFHPLWGLGMASSFDTTLVAIMYPIVLMNLPRKVILKYLYISVPIVAIFITKGSVGIGCLCLAMVVMARNVKYLIAPFVIFISYWIYDVNLFSMSERVPCYIWTFKWWSQQSVITHVFGTGLGTFGIIGPYIQKMNGIRTDAIFAWLHSDWLQILFETGAVGLSITVSFFVYLVHKSRSNVYLFGTIITIGASAVFYYPLRNPVTAIFIALTIKEIVLYSNNKNKTIL